MSPKLHRDGSSLRRLLFLSLALASGLPNAAGASEKAAAGSAEHSCALPGSEALCRHLVDMAGLAVNLAAQGNPVAAAASERHCAWFSKNYPTYLDRLRARVPLSKQAERGATSTVQLARGSPILEQADLFCRTIANPSLVMDGAAAAGTFRSVSGSISLGYALARYREVRPLPPPPAPVRPAPPAPAPPAPAPPPDSSWQPTAASGSQGLDVESPTTGSVTVDITPVNDVHRRADEGTRRGLLTGGLAMIGVSLGLGGLGGGLLYGWRQEARAAAESISETEQTQHQGQAHSYYQGGLISLGIAAATLTTGLILAVCSTAFRRRPEHPRRAPRPSIAVTPDSLALRFP